LRITEVAYDGGTGLSEAAFREVVTGSPWGRERLLRLRSVMPDESPIDLDEHAAVITLEVERACASTEYVKLVRAHVENTREHVRDSQARADLTRRYIQHARSVLDEMRTKLEP
jgi:predicted component of type VI protein secretion system